MLNTYQQTDGQSNVVGTATLTEVPDQQATWRLDHIEVIPEAWGNGWGSLLLDAVKDAADSEGVVLVLTVSDPGDQAPLSRRKLCKWFGRHGWISAEDDLYEMTRQSPI